jgi:DNA polymerase-3 subunit chi
LALAMFYHLTRSGADATLQTLLPRAITAGWRVMIRGGDAEALQRLDTLLWLEPEDGFLPHGVEGGPHDADQPVLLGQGPAVNGAQALALIDGADVTLDEAARMERVWAIFDGQDPQAVARARGLWTRLTGAGLAAQYWSEESGRWEKKAEKPSA